MNGEVGQVHWWAGFTTERFFWCYSHGRGWLQRKQTGAIPPTSGADFTLTNRHRGFQFGPGLSKAVGGCVKQAPTQQQQHCRTHSQPLAQSQSPPHHSCKSDQRHSRRLRSREEK